MSDSRLAEEEKRKVFLGGLSFDTREDDIYKDFGKFGKLESVSLPAGYDGKHKGFSFITFADAKDAEDACAEYHQKDYMGREISARIVVPRDEGGGRGGGGGYGGGPERGLPELSAEMNDKLEEWVAAKRRRDFDVSDRIRQEMKEQGVNPERYRPDPRRSGGYGGGGGYDRYDDRRGDRYDDRRGDRYDDRRGDRYDDRRDRRDRSYSPDRRRGRSYSPDRRRDRSYSPDRRRDDRRRDDRY